MISFRKLVGVAQHFINLFYRIVNLLHALLLGIPHGKRYIIHGRLAFRVASKASIKIGDNFYYSSGRNLNPLCASDRGMICVNDGALLSIGKNVGMSSTRIWSHSSITIGNNVLIGGGCILVDSDCHSLQWMDRREITHDVAHKKCAPIVIDDDVMIGMNCLILKGVHIGARTVIGAGSVVSKDIPSDCIAAGNPAKVIKRL